MTYFCLIADRGRNINYLPVQSRYLLTLYFREIMHSYIFHIRITSAMSSCESQVIFGYYNRTHPCAHSASVRDFSTNAGCAEGLLKVLVFSQVACIQGRSHLVESRVQLIIFIHHHSSSRLRVSTETRCAIVSRTQHSFPLLIRGFIETLIQHTFKFFVTFVVTPYPWQRLSYQRQRSTIIGQSQLIIVWNLNIMFSIKSCKCRFKRPQYK